MNYKLFFGFEKTPFGSDIPIREILPTGQLEAAMKRLAYSIELGGVFLITGEIGSGKSTAVRFLLNDLHPSEYRVLFVTATSGSILELYRLILADPGMKPSGLSRASMTCAIKQQVMEITNRKKKALLVIDEASLLRLEVFVELHTLSQFEMDSKPFLPLVLTGQSHLIEHLRYPSCMPLASRIVARSHFTGAERDQTESCLLHHLSIAGVKRMVFDDAAVTAIHQGSGGIFRKVNHLARGSLIAAAGKNQEIVGPDHVRTAASEIF